MEKRAKRANMIVRTICLISVVERFSVASEAKARTSETQHMSFDLVKTPLTEASIAPKG